MVKITERQTETWYKMKEEGYTFVEISWLACEDWQLIQYHVNKYKQNIEIE
jgi:hypothetical protein